MEESTSKLSMLVEDVHAFRGVVISSQQELAGVIWLTTRSRVESRLVQDQRRLALVLRYLDDVGRKTLQVGIGSIQSSGRCGH